jgi:cold shock CspA family protein
MSSSSPQSNDSTTRSVGLVKWFNKKQGFGFIHVLDGEQKGNDIFVHFSSIRDKDNAKQNYKYLIQGEYVEFVVEAATKGNHKYQVVDVTGIKENSILCETRYNANLIRNGTSASTGERGYYKGKQSSLPLDADE